jgi:hypothetical protein
VVQYLADIVSALSGEDAMHARVWQLQVRPGRVQDFQDVFSSVVGLARRQGGYRGVLALASGKSESPDVTVVALLGFLRGDSRQRKQFVSHAGHLALSGLL